MDVTVDINDQGDGIRFNATRFRACFMTAIEAASRWSSINLISLPPRGEYKDMQILQPLTHLESLKLACGSGEFFEQFMIAISRNAPPNLTSMDITDSAAVLCLAQPAYSHIYHSLRTLKIQLLGRMDSPVDILLHLQRLETLEACRLCLPIYSPDSPLPLIRTLRFLYLKSVSVQWMAGHVFPALEKCCITFLHHTDTIYSSQPVTMPSCSFLLYNSNDLRPLTQFHLPSLNTLDVKNAQWNVWRGNPQLARLCPIVSTRPQTLTVLHLDVKCSDRVLGIVLELAPALEKLWLGLDHPNALSKTFFQAFIAGELHSGGVSEMVRPPSQMIGPLCPSLKLLHLHYRRWMRGPDKNALVVTLGDIVGSRQLETESSFSIRLSFDEALEGSHWTIGKPVRKILNLRKGVLTLGISTLHGIVTMSRLLPKGGVASLPFKKPESLHLLVGHSTCLEFLFIRDHVELTVHNYHRLSPPSSLPCPLPLFYALKVLVIKCDNPSFLAGHTFHKLERCRLLKVRWSEDRPSHRMLTETGMPVCTRVDVDDPWVLAAFKLPQIHELALDFSDSSCSVIWERHIAVNANLSGLSLLHMKWWRQNRDLAPILRWLPLLETLIITALEGVDLFRAFLPMDANATSGLKQTSGEGKMLAVLCPRLQHLQIEREDIWVQPPLVLYAKIIISQRAVCGSPLKVFSCAQFSPKPGRKFELIGRDGSFAMEESPLTEGDRRFKLDI